MNFLRSSLKGRLIFQFLLVAVVPVVIVAGLSFNSNKRELEHAAFTQMKTVNQINRQQITDFFSRTINDIELLASSNDIQAGLNKLRHYHDKSDVAAQGKFPTHGDVYKSISSAIDPYVASYLANYDYDDLFLICAKHGHVMYSANKNSDLGANLGSGVLSSSGLAAAWGKVVESGKLTINDFSDYSPSGRPEMFIGVPVKDTSGTIQAVLVVAVSIDNINQIMEQYGQFGETGESYLVGSDKKLRSELRFDSGEVLQKNVDSESVRLALDDKAGVHISVNYGGREVLSAYTHMGLNERFGVDFEWAVVSDIHSAEALAPVHKLLSDILMICLPLIALACLLGWWSALRVVKPVQATLRNIEKLSMGDLNISNDEICGNDELGKMRNAFVRMSKVLQRRSEQITKVAAGDLSDDVEVMSEQDVVGKAMSDMVAGLREITASARQISAGDLDVDFSERSDKDELGIALRQMIDNLREIIGELVGGTATLAASVRQLSSTSSLLASGAAETSTSMAEVSATVDEVRQTSQISKERAEQVAELAEDANVYAEKGTEATRKTVVGMNLIKEEMDYIAESIVALSEHGQSVGDIVETVNDLADQSNLLSVNASIEAAKAGEHGKGFTVVAQEVKSLAAQSKQATEQIKTILQDIQKATGSAVMATERGAKAVHAGVELMAQSDETIQVMSDNIGSSADFALQIASSSQQQLAGVEQVAQAMLSIKDAGQQNMDSARQLEDATQRLETLAVDLQQLSERFTL